MHGQLEAAKTEHDDLKQDVDDLGHVTPDNWPSMKSSIERRMSSLDGRLRELNDAIHDV